MPEPLGLASRNRKQVGTVRPAALFFVSGTQINAQVPFELVSGAGLVTVQVTRGGETSTAQPVAIAAVSPGIFTQNQQGTGPGAILHAADFQPVSESNPAQTGEFLLIFCTGLGPVLPEVPSGNVAPGTEPLARTVSPPLVNIGGIPAEVVYSGLAPGFVGLYQVNVEVPVGLSPPEFAAGGCRPARYAQPRNHQHRCAEQHRRGTRGNKPADYLVPEGLSQPILTT